MILQHYDNLKFCFTVYVYLKMAKVALLAYVQQFLFYQESLVLQAKEYTTATPTPGIRLLKHCDILQDKNMWMAGFLYTTLPEHNAQVHVGSKATVHRQTCDCFGYALVFSTVSALIQ